MPHGTETYGHPGSQGGDHKVEHGTMMGRNSKEQESHDQLGNASRRGDEAQTVEDVMQKR